MSLFSAIRDGGQIALELKESQYILSVNGQEFVSTYDVLYALELYERFSS